MLDDNCWRGEKVFVVGGGESKAALDLSRMREHRVIACNVAAFEVACDVAVALDRRVFDRYKAAWSALDAAGREMIYVNANWGGGDRFPGFVRELPASRDHAWTETLADGALLFSNTGLTALHLAYLAGAAEIVLVGFDLVATGKLTTGALYPENEKTDAKATYQKFAEAFTRYAPRLKSRRVVNVNASSAIRDFEFGDYEKECRA